jgi:hypothetical protein
MADVTRYTVSHHEEETECRTCRKYLIVGDTVYWHDEADRAYCSTFCAWESEE